MLPIMTWALILLLPLCLIYFKPLSNHTGRFNSACRIPNAFWFAHLSHIPYIFLRLAGFRSKKLHELHKTHPVLQIGPRSFSFSSPEAIRAIYGHGTKCHKGGTYVAVPNAHPNVLDAVNKDDHAAQRRMLSHAFATRNLQGWEFKINDKICNLVWQFDRICRADGDNATVDFRLWSNLFTVDAIVDIAFSRRLGLLEQGNDSVEFTASNQEVCRMKYINDLHAGRRATSTFIWSTTWFNMVRRILMKIPGYYKKQWSRGQKYDILIQHLVRERIGRFHRGEDLDDLIRCLLVDKHGTARELDVEQINSEANILLDAGSDTTAIALTHVMYLLAKHPDKLHSLRREVDAALRHRNTPCVTYDAVKTLPYLSACLDESLRLFPPVAFGLNRETPSEGLTIDGVHIPGNNLVAVPAYTAHRNPRLFPDPEQFVPERWLPSDMGSADAIKHLQVSFIPFSAGARGCIGRNITYMEQKMLVATLVSRYDFELVYPGPDLTHEEAFNLWPGPLPLRIKTRRGAAD